RIT
ncbi:hypothetical protein D049_4284B, partial [Vibrio parahaemolyticus VPTS-2010]